MAFIANLLPYKNASCQQQLQKMNVRFRCLGFLWHQLVTG